MKESEGNESLATKTHVLKLPSSILSKTDLPTNEPGHVFLNLNFDSWTLTVSPISADGSRTLAVNKKLVRVVTESETEDVLTLRLEPKQ